MPTVLPIPVTNLSISRPNETIHGFHDLFPNIAREPKCTRGWAMKANSPIRRMVLNSEYLLSCPREFVCLL